MSLFNRNWPINPSVTTPGPTQFVKDGIDTEVEQDTITPSNSVPLPVRLLNPNGTEVTPATAANQATANTSLASIDTNTANAEVHLANSLTKLDDIITPTTNLDSAVGAKSDAAATTDTGTFSLLAFVKRGMENWTSLLAKLPALVSGRIPVDGSGVTQPVSAASLPLPTGASTAANQTTTNGHLSTLAGAVAGTEMQVDIVSSALPTGAATEATLSTLNGKVTAVDTGNVTVASSALPTGAATAANQATGNTSLSNIDGKLPSLSGGRVPTEATQSGTWTVQPGNTANTTAWLVRQAGKAVVNTARNDYSSVNVTTGAWTELVASTSAAIIEIEIFDSSGSTLELGTGAAAAEARLLLVTPGGNGRVPVAIAAGTRVSIRAVSGTASAGEICLNCYGV
jgi:hypothetical protein